MIILIGGASHTGKTLLAQKLLEKYGFPYLSMDHLKMGLIRSGMTDLTVYDDDKLTGYLWRILREMIKTAIENEQNLIVEGCYIPFDWKKDFSEAYLKNIRCLFLVMTPEYVRSHFTDIREYANVIERRLDDSGLNADELIQDNLRVLEGCRRHGCECVRIDKEYPIDIL